MSKVKEAGLWRVEDPVEINIDWLNSLNISVRHVFIEDGYLGWVADCRDFIGIALIFWIAKLVKVNVLGG
jgi:hypothetical protein